tara:strand:- start:230 stop:349 length:120 start_codon:yes stop_codon:yes gene_type:complete
MLHQFSTKDPTLIFSRADNTKEDIDLSITPPLGIDCFQL